MASAGTSEITVRRVGTGTFELRTADGQVVRIGEGGCSPTELLLAAVAASIGADIDAVVSRRAEPTGFEVEASADAVRGTNGNTLDNLELRVRLGLPSDSSGAAALAPRAAQYSMERTSAVAKVLQTQTSISMKLE